MCRLYGLHANALSRVECGLVRGQNALLSQSRRDLRGRANPDGWGIALYDNGFPVVERRSTAASANLRFSEVAASASAHTAVAHVRAASIGGAALENTHPFSWGRWTFAHNGTVSAFDRVGPRLEAETAPDLLKQRRGSTDSELCFLWLLARLRRAGVNLEGPSLNLERAVERIGASIAALDALCRSEDPGRAAVLNFVLTNGRALIAMRWNASLHWLMREGASCCGPCDCCDHCGEAHRSSGDGARFRALVVASEPICRGAWQELPEHGLVASDEAIRISRQAL